MEQYIYANVKREAYKMVSSSPDFFGNVRNATLMRHLINHDNHCPHGELKPWEHQSFWMVTTDMDRPGEVPRLFLQASGGDDHRDGIYVHGYMCEVPKSQMAIYEDHLPEILSLTFLDKESALKTAEALTLPQITLQEAKSAPNFREMDIAPQILKYILLELLGRRKVIIRIPSSGEDAMMDSRRMLLTIYNRLPYDYRASTGFITGSSLSALTNQQNPLPGAVNLILLDGDADISSYRTRPSQVLIDLKNCPSRFPEMEKISPICTQMLSYLVDNYSEERKQFFDFAKRLKEILKPTQRMELPDYLPVYQMYSAIHGNLTEASVKFMAVMPFTTPNWNARINEFYSRILAERIDPDQMLHYFRNQIKNFSCFPVFGEIDKAEYEKIRLDKSGSMEIKDQNFGLVMHMLETIIPYYKDSSQERARLVEGLSDIFKHKALEELEWMTEPNPTGKTVEQMHQVKLPQIVGESSVAMDVKKKVSLAVTQKQQEMDSLYEQNYHDQAQSGAETIAAWPGKGNNSIEDLYASLQQHNYLYDELIDAEENGWNNQIIYRIKQVFSNKSPEKTEEFLKMQDEIEHVLDFYGTHFPCLKSQLEKHLFERQNWCRKATDLAQRPCSSLAELLDLMMSLNSLKYSKTFCDLLMQKWINQIFASPITWSDICTLQQKICTAGMHTENSTYLRTVLSHCPDLLVISEKMIDDDAITKLRHLESLEKAQVLPGEIYSERLKKSGTAAAIKQDYIRLRDERLRKARPNLSFISSSWRKSAYDKNSDYKYPDSYYEDYQKNSQHNLSAGTKQKNGDSRWTYSGYSDKTSRYHDPQTNGKASWAGGRNQKVPYTERKLKRPILPQIPDMEQLNKKQRRVGLVVGSTLLTGLSGAIPAAALFLLDATLMNSGITTAVLSASLLGLETVSFAVHGKTRKVLMRSMGASLLPGILVSAAALIQVLY